MKLNEMNGKKNLPDEIVEPIEDRHESSAHPRLSLSPEPELIDGQSGTREPETFATRAELTNKAGLEQNKLILLGGGLMVAVLFFVFTVMMNKSSTKKKQQNSSQQNSQQTPDHPKGSVTPLMETVRKPSPENVDGQLNAGDIRRTKTSDSSAATVPSSPAGHPPTKPLSGPGGSLASVPSFSDTQQKWEEPRPYGESPETAPAHTQQQPASLKEPSLAFVRSQSQASSNLKQAQNDYDASVLELPPETRVLAKLQDAISSADPTTVVAVVQYTYAIGDQVIVPAGALIFGQLTHADSSGNVGVRFDEIQLSDGPKEKIDAVGKDLDMGPIKGTVTGKNTGRNFAIRAASGIGSVAAMLVGNNTSSSFSEQDLLRERIAQNIGNAGDSELLGLNAKGRGTVSLAASTKFQPDLSQPHPTPSTLHK